MAVHDHYPGALLQPADEAWLDIRTVDQLLAAYPETVKGLLASLDLRQRRFVDVKNALNAEDLEAACKALLNYFRDPVVQPDLRGGTRELHQDELDAAIDLANDRVVLEKVEDTVPKTNGAWDWNHRGPRVYHEWARALNRHRYSRTLLRTWQATGDDAHTATFDRILRDWVLHAPRPVEGNNSYTWRPLEAARRIEYWVEAFFGFQTSGAFTPAARLLMLASFVEHGDYLHRFHTRSSGNHKVTELSSLYAIANTFPEFRQSTVWRSYARKEMTSEIQYQVYPDGAHSELSTHYHLVVMRSFERFAAQGAADPKGVPASFMSRLARMHDYLAATIQPDGSLPMNNRSDRNTHAPMLLREAARRYKKPQWLYPATNGEEGTAPSAGPSYFHNYSGHLISRSGWDRDAHWGYFEVGPYGHGNVHADRLHVSLSAFGQDLLVDSGRFWYQGDRWTDHALSSRSHNVLLIDGRDQLIPEDELRADNPVSKRDYAVAESFDFARGTVHAFEDLEGAASHQRTLVFVRNLGWVAIDQIETDRPRKVTAMWHFHPHCNVLLDGDQTRTDNPRGNLRITPLGELTWQTSLHRGETSPDIQGWYAPESPHWEPATCAVYETTVSGSACFAWLLWPGEGPVAPIHSATIGKTKSATLIDFCPEGGTQVALRLPASGSAPQVVIKKAD